MGAKYKEGKKSALMAKEPAKQQRKFEFPSNVKQVGGINKGVKIYIEDYAYTYITKLGLKAEKKETAAFLIGFQTVELGEQILVISGAVKPPFATQPEAGKVFSDGDWQYARDIAGKYFEGLEIVGWARLQPGYGLYLSASDISSHYLSFSDKSSVLFLIDPHEKLNCFFSWDEEQDDLTEVSGYFIYYDKNNEMNAYIADAKKAKKNGKKTGEFDVSTELEAGEVDAEEQPETEGITLARSVEHAKRLAEVHRQKRIISMMTSVSVLLFFACLIMGVGLLQNGERLSSIETQMREMRTGYNNMVTKLNDSVFPTFAAQAETAVTEPEEFESPNVKNEPQTEPEPTAKEKESQQSIDEAFGVTAIETPPPDESAEPVVYVVQQGDTLTYISGKFYGAADGITKIMEANGIENPDRLIVGMELIIPQE